MLFGFEDGDLRHEWSLEQDRDGQWRPSPGQQRGTVRDGAFERLLDGVVRDKEKVRSRGITLVTPFEATRLAPPPALDEEASRDDAGSSTSFGSYGTEHLQVPSITVPFSPADKAGFTSVRHSTLNGFLAGDEEAREIEEAMRGALRSAGLSPEILGRGATLKDLLGSIFDAADEDGAGRLQHHEVARLLGAMLPGLGLERWDIDNLMGSAEESEDGFIEYQPFVDSSPAIIQVLRKQRMSYKARGLPGVEIPGESVRFCFGDEVTTTVEMLTKAFEACAQEDPGRGIFRKINVRKSMSMSVHGTLARAEADALAAAALLGSAHGRRASFISRTPTMELQEQSSTAKKTASLDPPAPNRAVRISGGAPLILTHLDDVAEHGRSTPSTSRHTPNGDDRVLVGLARRFCHSCLEASSARVSTQEAERLMQTLVEDEAGFVFVDDIGEQLTCLREEALSNAMVETDVPVLRKHLAEVFLRNFGLKSVRERCSVNLWELKDALMDAEQVCLTRLQIHVLVCLAPPSTTEDGVGVGVVDAASFLGQCCAIIPHMFDAKAFVATAERLQLEHAEAVRRDENAELAALGAATVTTGVRDDDSKQNGGQDDRMLDQEGVERTLIQVLASQDDLHRNPPALSPQSICQILLNASEVQTCGVTRPELIGFLAELSPDPASGEVVYVEHVRRWVPIIFELRKNGLLGAYLEDDAMDTLKIEKPDISAAIQELSPPVADTRRLSIGSMRSAFVRGVSNALSERPLSGRRSSFGSDISRDLSKEDMMLPPLTPSSHLQLPRLRVRRRTQNNVAPKLCEDSLAGMGFEGGLESTKANSNPHGRGHARRRMMLSRT